MAFAMCLTNSSSVEGPVEAGPFHYCCYPCLVPVSSANLNTELTKSISKSSMKIKNKTGPKTIVHYVENKAYL